MCISHTYTRSMIWMLALRFWTGRHFSGHACLRAALQAPSGAGKWSRPCKSRTENLSTFWFVGCVFCQRGCFQTAPFSASQRKIHRRRSCGLGKACRLHTLTLTISYISYLCASLRLVLDGSVLLLKGRVPCLEEGTGNHWQRAQLNWCRMFCGNAAEFHRISLYTYIINIYIYMLELQKTPLWIWVRLRAVKCCACLSADHCITCYISFSWIGAPYWDIWLRRKWNAATYRRCWVLTLTWAMLFSRLLRQLKGSWPKMPSLNRIKQAQGTPASKWRWCSDTSRTPYTSEIRRGLTRKARANWRFITWRTRQKALSGVKSMTPASSHVSLTSAAWAFWSGRCWPGSFPAASNCKCIKALAWSSKTPRTSVCVVF